MQRFVPIVAICMATALCTSCGSGRTRKPTYAVEGQVFSKDGKSPAINALVVLRPVKGADEANWPEGFPRGTVGANGTFKVTTYTDGDGAPEGEYAILVTWPQAAKKGAERDEEAPSVDRLNGQFSDPASPRWTKRVKAGDNSPSDFVFILQHVRSGEESRIRGD